MAAVGLLMLAALARPAAAGQDEYQGIGPLLNQLRFASDDDDREDAAKALGKLGDPGALPFLMQAAVYDRKDDVRDEARKSALKITGKLPPRDGLVFTPDLIGRLTRDLMDARDDDDREKAAKELGWLGDPRALTALEIAAVFDKKDDVRDQARKSAEQIRKDLGPIREELSYRYYTPTPEPAPQYAPPPPAPAPRFEPAPRFDYSNPPPPPQPEDRPNEPYYYSPPPAGPDTSGRYIDNGTVNTPNTTINNTYSYTYNNTYNYNSNNTTVNPPAESYPTTRYLPPSSYIPPATYIPTGSYLPPAIYTPATARARATPPLLPPVRERQIEIRSSVILQQQRVVARQPVVTRPIVVPDGRLGRRPTVRTERGLSISFEFNRTSGTSPRRR